MRWHRRLRNLSPHQPAKKQKRPKQRVRLQLEELETRAMLSANSATPVQPATNEAVHPVLTVTPQQTSPQETSPPVSGSTPQEIRQIYGFDQIPAVNGQTINGAGETIAIVDAFYDPDIISDANTFNSQFNLPLFNSPGGPTLTVVASGGGAASSVSQDPTGAWPLETSLDVEWAHAMAPQANILLVEAPDGSDASAFDAAKYAAAQPGVVAVSMSWGDYEFSGETGYDSDFVPPSSNPGVTFVAASGDEGAFSGPLYPATSPYVLAVGGTTLGSSAGSAGSSGSSGSFGSFVSNGNSASARAGGGLYSGVGSLSINPAASPSASFVKTDTTTQGNWKGVYGSQGYNVIEEASSFPSYAQVSASGNTGWIWSGTTDESRALQEVGNDYRWAASWFSNSTFTVNMNLSDGQTHQLALYLLDWDSKDRSEQIQITNATTGAVLSTQTASNFVNGEYLVWNVSGDINISITHLGGDNAVLSGLFLDPAPPAPPAPPPPPGGSGTNTYYQGETAWSGSGGGAASYEGEPSFQYNQQSIDDAFGFPNVEVTNNSNGTTNYYYSRMTPDVAYNADPSTGYAIYDSIASPNYGTSAGWNVVGGTSAAAPQWSAIIALTDQERALEGKAPLDTNQVQNQLYNSLSNSSTYANIFHDVTKGSNGYGAGTGYDLATGLGTPITNNLIPYLASTTIPLGQLPDVQGSGFGGYGSSGLGAGSSSSASGSSWSSFSSWFARSASDRPGGGLYAVSSSLSISPSSADAYGLNGQMGNTATASFTPPASSLTFTVSTTEPVTIGMATNENNFLGQVSTLTPGSSLSTAGSTPLAASTNAQAAQGNLVLGASGWNGSALSWRLSSLGLPAAEIGQLADDLSANLQDENDRSADDNLLGDGDDSEEDSSLFDYTIDTAGMDSSALGLTAQGRSNEGNAGDGDG